MTSALFFWLMCVRHICKHCIVLGGMLNIRCTDLYIHYLQLTASDVQADHFRQALHKRTSLAVLVKVYYR